MDNRIIKLSLDVEIRDKEGRIKYKLTKPADTFLHNFGEFMYAGMFSGNPTTHYASLKATNGSTYSVDFSLNTSILITGADAIDTNGIIVGDSDTAVTYTDYILGNKISHSGSALYYKAQTRALESPNEGELTIGRAFENLAVASVDIKEMGLQWKIGSYMYLIARDVITTATLATNDILNAKYIVDWKP